MGHADQFLATYAISFDVFLLIFFPVDQRNDFSVRLICTVVVMENAYRHKLNRLTYICSLHVKFPKVQSYVTDVTIVLPLYVQSTRFKFTKL